MILFVTGLIVFFGTHLFTAVARPTRERLIARIGAGPYRGVYSLISLAGFAMIIAGWSGADATALYAPPPWMRHVTYLLTFVALILLAASLLPKGKIAAAAKHPMLAAVKLWAFGHLLANGEVRSVMLFGAFLAFAIFDRIALKRRDAPTPVAGPVVNDAIAVALGAIAAGLIVLYLHPYIAGVALRP